jgi:Flp pilus assembly protein TadD
MEEGRHAEATAMLAQASALAPEEQSIREHHGLALFYNKQYREAAMVLQRLMKDDKYKTRADLHTALGECHLEIGEPREARDCFEIASQLRPNDVSAWLNIAKTALQLNDLKRADISLRKAMTIDAKSADVHLLMGYLRLQQAKLDEALTSFRKASQLDPQDAVALCMTGFVLEKMGRSNEAIRFYSQALKIKPNDELATSLLAKVQVQE